MKDTTQHEETLAQVWGAHIAEWFGGEHEDIDPSTEIFEQARRASMRLVASARDRRKLLYVFLDRSVLEINEVDDFRISIKAYKVKEDKWEEFLEMVDQQIHLHQRLALLQRLRKEVTDHE